MAKKDSTVIKDNLYKTVETSLNKPENSKEFKRNIDHYMASHIDSYSTPGPSTRPTINPTIVNGLYKVLGLTETEIKVTLKQVPGNTGSWKYFNNPYNIAIVLSIRFFTIKKDEVQLNNALLYMLTNIYQYMFIKYYPKFNPNEATMAYTIANLSQRFKIKKTGTILGALSDITRTCYDTHKDRIIRFNDEDILKFINDEVSRINSFMKKLRDEYETNVKNENYLQSEKDNYTDEHYYEADSDSFAIDRITNKILTSLVVNGPDRKLIELAAKNSSVSVNVLQTSILTLISESHRDDIKRIIECLLSLYLNDNPDKTASLKDIGTNKFYVYCIKVYRQSNTVNKNIIEVKAILDKWIKELNLASKVSTAGSIGNYRKAIFTFFIFTIEKLC